MFYCELCTSVQISFSKIERLITFFSLKVDALIEYDSYSHVCQQTFSGFPQLQVSQGHFLLLLKWTTNIIMFNHHELLQGFWMVNELFTCENTFLWVFWTWVFTLQGTLHFVLWKKLGMFLLWLVVLLLSLTKVTHWVFENIGLARYPCILSLLYFISEVFLPCLSWK